MINPDATKHSVGKALTAGTSNTLFTVPNGYHAYVTMVFIANAGGSTAAVSAAWHDGATITFQGDKSVSAGEAIQFGGDGEGLGLVMKSGDYMTVTPAAGSTFTAIATFELFPHEASDVSF